MDADTRLAEIRAREAAASKAPWTVEAHQPTLTRHVVSGDFMLDADLGYLGNNNQDDARFIAAAREDVPWLLAEVARLQADREVARIQLGIAEQRVEELAAENRLYERALGLNEAA